MKRLFWGERIDVSLRFFCTFVSFLIDIPMFLSVYVFNPDYDMAMANFTPYYKAPAEIIRMADDLSVLPVWFAREGCGVKVDSLDRVELFHRQLSEVCRMGENWQTCFQWAGSTGWTDKWVSACYTPWGWTPSLVHRLRQEGVEDCYLPSSEEMCRIRYLSSRQRCLEVLPAFSGWNGICGEMKWCHNLQEVENFIYEKGNVIVKAPWSGSGRGLWKVSAESWNPSLAGWVSRILKVQGGIMVEPIYDKVEDFAMEFIAGEEGVRFLGYSCFETDVHGNYKANRLMSNSAIETRLSQYVPLELLHRIRVSLERVLTDLLGQDYRGYLGVDMMVCREEGAFRVHPCVEINLRMNMGVLSRILYDRYVHPLSEGEYVVEHYACEGEALSFHQKMIREFPLRWAEGKWSDGYLPLTPVREDTRFQAYLLVDGKGGK